MTDRPTRASDRERESVVDVLRDAYTDGRLTLDEFEERTSAAYASKTWSDLRELTGDLPVEPVLGADLPQRQVSAEHWFEDRKSTRLNSSHLVISYAVFCLQKKKKEIVPVATP